MEKEFEPVTAKTFRLDITNSVGTPRRCSRNSQTAVLPMTLEI
jgi:hypothetical protein